MSHVSRNGLRPYFMNQRRGLTLVELLVVLGVVSVLTAIILPSIKTVLTDRKSSQSAIIVKNFFEAARARAIGKNRTVAVVLERVSSRVDPSSFPSFVSATASSTVTGPDSNFVPYNACIRMSLAEEPLPFNERMLPSVATMHPRVTTIPKIPDFPTDDYVDEDSVVDIHGATEIRAFNVQGLEPALQVLATHLVAGSEISFGDSKRRFAIVSPRTPSIHQNFINRHRGNSVPQGIWFSIVNELGEEESGERASAPYFVFDAISSPGFSTIKIYGRPKPIYSEMVQLPRGMCIDLSLSGFANESPRNDTSSTPNGRPIFDSTTGPFPEPLSDYRVRFASDWIANGTVPTPPELRPVYFSFTPDGTLSHVWANERSGVNLRRIDATQDIFLHIGKIDQIVLPIDPAIGGRNKAAHDAIVASGTRQNLTDLNSFVLRLSPKTGTITASPIVGLDTQIGILGLAPGTLSLGDLIELSRRGTYSSNVTSQ